MSVRQGCGPVCEVPVASWADQKSLERLKDLILTGLDKPMLFQDKIHSWKSTQEWSVAGICHILGKKQTTFKVCPRRGSNTFKEHFKENNVIFETQCCYENATFSDFLQWIKMEDAVAGSSQESGDADRTLDTERLSSNGKNSEEQSVKRPKLDSSQLVEDHSPIAPSLHLPNPLLGYPRSEYWIYADYKYMCQLCSDMPELQSAIDWSVFGFGGLSGKDSTLWVGSEEAYTPCHYDTYGCNLVAQLSGKKRWTLYSPGDSQNLYPTRVPYEESSVFSSVNVVSPDIVTYPEFAKATAYQVTLIPGEVLFVPRHWWHYVECVEPAVSVNTWIELPVDVHERMKEALVRTLVSVLSTEPLESEEELINPNEVIFPHEENLRLLSLALRAQQEGSSHSQVTTQDLINVLTSDGVMEQCVAELLKRSCS